MLTVSPEAAAAMASRKEQLVSQVPSLESTFVVTVRVAPSATPSQGVETTARTNRLTASEIHFKPLVLRIDSPSSGK
jgi:hypothetical protein